MKSIYMEIIRHGRNTDTTLTRYEKHVAPRIRSGLWQATTLFRHTCDVVGVELEDRKPGHAREVT